MTAADAFEKWWSQRIPGLPWDVDKTTAAEAFTAGWVAHESIASVAQLAEHRICNAGVAGSTPAASSRHEGKWVDGPGITPEAIYAAYPRKIGKQAAIKAIRTQIKLLARLGTLEGAKNEAWLLGKTKAYAAAVAQWPEAEKQYIPHPATWFNRGSYEDDPKEWQRGTATTSQFRTHH